MKVLAELRKIKDDMWKNGTVLEEFYNRVLHRVKCLYTQIKMSHPGDDIKNIGKQNIVLLFSKLKMY